MMHGFPDNVHLYDPLAPLLATDNRVITFDFLGWGQSDKPADHHYGPDSLLADLEAVIEHFSLDFMTVVAHDVSGLPAIDWALSNPDRVVRLVLLNTVYHTSSARKPSAAVKLFSTPSLQRDIIQFVASQNDRLWQGRLTSQGETLFKNQQAQETYLNLFVHAAPTIRPAFFGLTAHINQATNDRLSKLEQIRNFPKPVSIIFGAEDTVLTAELAQEFHELFPNSELHLIDGAGYMLDDLAN
ncbi:alpha/beta hydrolase [Chloroflexi bacterium TSY]|nr:alpha/beta hydrolase [Chloroflexi bacterium TSY]